MRHRKIFFFNFGIFYNFSAYKKFKRRDYEKKKGAENYCRKIVQDGRIQEIIKRNL